MMKLNWKGAGRKYYGNPAFLCLQWQDLLKSGIYYTLWSIHGNTWNAICSWQIFNDGLRINFNEHRIHH